MPPPTCRNGCAATTSARMISTNLWRPCVTVSKPSSQPGSQRWKRRLLCQAVPCQIFTGSAGSGSHHKAPLPARVRLAFCFQVSARCGKRRASKERPGQSIIGRHQKGSHNVFIRCSEDPNFEICKRTKSTRAKGKTKPQKRTDGICAVDEKLDVTTADHKVLKVGNVSRGGHRDAVIEAR